MRVPYFYIIKHINTNRFYVGSAWGKKVNPDQLLKEGGYMTSSSYVHKIIKEDGLKSFVIDTIITEEELQIPFNNIRTVLEYETWFQNFHDCASSVKWINKRNNNFKNHNWPLYDVEVKKKHKEIMNAPETIEKKKKTSLLNHGVDHYSKTEEFKISMSQYWTDRDSNPYELCDKNKHREIMNDPLLWDQIRETQNLIYGGHPMQNDAVKQKSIDTNISKYGVDNYTKTDDFRNQMSTNNPMYDRDIAIKHFSMAAATGKKISAVLSKINDVTCPHCGKSGKGTGAMYQWHFDRCKFNGGIGLIRAKKHSLIEVIDSDGNITKISKKTLSDQKIEYGLYKGDWKYVLLNTRLGNSRIQNSTH